MSDLREAAGVNERALQYAFPEVTGMTPVMYLTQMRKALRAATQGLTTVTAEALRWSFGHFSDFCRAYKECSGELPSETLRR